MQEPLTRRRRLGFSLMEMIMVLVLMGIIGAAFASFLSPAVRGFAAQSQRAALVDSAESALRRMARDVRIALPNSVRIAAGPGFALEMIPTVDGGRYCSSGLADCSSGDPLDFASADTSFDILGFFSDTGFTGSTNNAYRLVIGNTGNEVYAAADADASAVITKSTATITISTVTVAGVARHHVAISAAAARQFSTQSPRERVFAVKAADAPITYLCDTSAKTLKRYAGYSFQSGQPTNAAAAPLSTATSVTLVASNVSSCSITSSTGGVQNTGIVLLSLGLMDPTSNESVSLVHQAPLDNSQ